MWINVLLDSGDEHDGTAPLGTAANALAIAISRRFLIDESSNMALIRGRYPGELAFRSGGKIAASSREAGCGSREAADARPAAGLALCGDV